MSEEIVKFKGSRSGLVLVLDTTADFAAIEQDIRTKLESGSNFFRRGTVIQVLPGVLNEEDTAKLMKLFHQYGVIFRIADNEPAAAETVAETAAEPQQPITAAAADTGLTQNMTVVNRTVRSGQEVTSQGAVLICGNVNPGAEIVAGGSIDIRGTCRGIVHAGAYGDTSAFVIADHLMPVQIRIAGLIAQAPDQIEKPDCAERASIKDGQIIIEPIER
jgi:septum site-determining protein MinC